MVIHSGHYTLERDNRELQQAFFFFFCNEKYTLERDNRELQLMWEVQNNAKNYTLERDNRELQHRLYLTNVNSELYP